MPLTTEQRVEIILLSGRDCATITFLINIGA